MGELIAGPKTISQVFDCAIAKELGLKPKSLTVGVHDATDAPSQDNRNKVAIAACKSIYGALKVAALESIPADWLRTVPLVLVDTAVNQAEQAMFFRKPFEGDATGTVIVTNKIIQDYSIDELAWVLGHEYAHGLQRHSEARMGTVGGGVALATAGALGLMLGRGALVRGLGALALAGGTAFATCGPAAQTSQQELDADAFGIRVLVHAGLSLIAAKAAATQVFQRHSEVAGKCLSPANDGFIDQNVHPSTIQREKAIQALK